MIKRVVRGSMTTKDLHGTPPFESYRNRFAGSSKTGRGEENATVRDRRYSYDVLFAELFDLAKAFVGGNSIL